VHFFIAPSRCLGTFRFFGGSGRWFKPKSFMVASTPPGCQGDRIVPTSGRLICFMRAPCPIFQAATVPNWVIIVSRPSYCPRNLFSPDYDSIKLVCRRRPRTRFQLTLLESSKRLFFLTKGLSHSYVLSPKLLNHLYLGSLVDRHVFSPTTAFSFFHFATL